MKTLDIDVLRRALSQYFEVKGPGSQSALAQKSGVSPMVLSRIARGISGTTPKSWGLLHKAEPAYIPDLAWQETAAAKEEDPSYGTPYNRLKLYAEMLRLAKEADDHDLADYVSNIIKARLDEMADDGKGDNNA